MLKKIASHLTYANVMATAAVFVAIGGGAYAAGLAKNSVGSKQIKDGQVKSQDLAANSVNASKVADGSLLGEDFATGQLPTGDQGPKGDQGVQGVKGDQGVPGLSGREVVVSESAFDSGASKSATATCPAGKKVIGGGSNIFPSLGDPSRDSAPITTKFDAPAGDNSWTVIAAELTGLGGYADSWKVEAAAICAVVG